MGGLPIFLSNVRWSREATEIIALAREKYRAEISFACESRLKLGFLSILTKTKSKYTICCQKLGLPAVIE
jgi:hypothetical protein